ncbi:RES family NAD+ phosphorylase [Paenibacillus sp. Lou8.1]|uniref:RES family NAD+ phosphorylase n=1 Tax=Paenibacillus sp. Lou8.1 TaxID=2962041 RepID=UPI0020B74028|nr:RES family NAD+ phosphorylase [Paenibacillus sp. Lou8.1]MCP3807149.1 RES family NAD+ phosphorylase [Paenibacillus sp. Lou8.1]
MYVTDDENTRKVYNEFKRKFLLSRYFIHEKKDDFIDFFLPALKNQIELIDQDKVLFRARINKTGEYFKDQDLQAPPQGKAGGGRMNPKGISYLYASETETTVITEVRPWIGATVTIAECQTKAPLKIINMVPDSAIGDTNSYKRVIGQEFSRPVRPDSSEIDYMPTQFIAEYFRDQGVDGVKYSSATHAGGINYLFFNPNEFNIKIKCSVEIKGINYEYQL